MVTEIISDEGGAISSRDVGRYLQSQPLGDSDGLAQLKLYHRNVVSFCHRYPNLFLTMNKEDAFGRSDPKEFLVVLRDGADGPRDEELAAAR